MTRRLIGLLVIFTLGLLVVSFAAEAPPAGMVRARMTCSGVPPSMWTRS
jgi:hypothetical protein